MLRPLAQQMGERHVSIFFFRPSVPVHEGKLKRREGHQLAGLDEVEVDPSEEVQLDVLEHEYRSILRGIDRRLSGGRHREQVLSSSPPARNIGQIDTKEGYLSQPIRIAVGGLISN